MVYWCPWTRQSSNLIIWALKVKLFKMHSLRNWVDLELQFLRWVLLLPGPASISIAHRIWRLHYKQIFIGGQHIGGCDDLQTAQSTGKLEQLLEDLTKTEASSWWTIEFTHTSRCTLLSGSSCRAFARRCYLTSMEAISNLVCATTLELA